MRVKIPKLTHTHIVQQLETEVDSSSSCLDTVEGQITSLQHELKQLKVEPQSRRPSVDSNISILSQTPEVMTKKMHFPLETRDTLITWMKQQTYKHYLVKKICTQLVIVQAKFKTLLEYVLRNCFTLVCP